MSKQLRKILSSKRLRRITAVTLLLLLSAWLIPAWVFAYRMSHRLRPIYVEPAPTLSWGKIEPVRLTTSDNEQIGAWLISGKPDRAGILMLHGIGANRSSCLDEAKMLVRAGHSVMLVTLRAHGDSTGEVNDFGFSARHDVAAAVGWWRKRFGDRPLVVWGQSLGSAAALFAAADLGEKVNGYLLECPYQNLRTATRNRTRLFLPRGIEWIAYCGLRCVAPVVLPHAEKISPVDAAATIPAHVPVLVLAGGCDPYARPEEAQMIYQCVKDHATLALFEKAEHMRLYKTDPARYRSTVLAFVDKCAKCGP